MALRTEKLKFLGQFGYIQPIYVTRYGTVTRARATRGYPHVGVAPPT